MSLKRQLACVSLLLLCLPWAGYQYLLEMYSSMQQRQQQMLESTTATIARALVVSHAAAEFHPQGTVATDAAGTNGSLYCLKQREAVWVDGYAAEDEWHERSLPAPTGLLAPAANPEGRNSYDYRCSVSEQQANVFLRINDPQRQYRNPTLSYMNGDRIELVTGTGQRYFFAAIAPGRVQALYEIQPGRFASEESINAFWLDREDGYDLEIEIPRSLLNGRLAFTALDGLLLPGFRQSTEAAQSLPPWYMYPAPELQTLIEPFVQPGLRLRLLDTQGRLLASAGHPQHVQGDDKQPVHWLLRWVYRYLLESQLGKAQSYQAGFDFSQRHEVNIALFSTETGTRHQTSQWYDNQSEPLLATAILLQEQPSRPLAVLVAEQGSQQSVALADHAFNRLFILTLAAMVFVLMALLGYSSWLSWRIRKLTLATERALAEPRDLQKHLPQSKAKDEIGQLTRQYASLMGRIDEYTDYLQGLSHKLSHELRTPLAIIHSSLDLLNNATDPAERARYLQRAQEGASRLGQLITAMSEARRVEESIESAEPEQVDLQRLLSQLTQAYQDLYLPLRVTLLGLPATPIPVRLVPDLLVQMLDKLMDNAQSYCPPEGQILIQYQDQDTAFELVVSNDGPLLPDLMQQQLFDNLVSIRSADQTGTHLGMGLHIVKLIVDFHQGQVWAANRADGTGVEFHIRLPKTCN